MKKCLLVYIVFILISSFSFGDSSSITNSSREEHFYESQEKIPPHALVIFGAAGDLTKRKLIPAIVQLARQGKLPEGFVCIGVGRNQLSDSEFREEISAFIPKEDREAWQRISDKMFYLSGSFEKSSTYTELGRMLEKLDRDRSMKGNRLFYLATPPDCFSMVVENLDEHRLLTGEGNRPEQWSRVIIEKPFGQDLPSAISLQKEIGRHLDESQIYLIDHYLGKEVVRQLLMFRFTNPVIESLWNNQQIEHVSITLSEEIGIGTRGQFWEQTGMLRDVVQNHIMQLIAMIAMEKPASFSAGDIRREKTLLIKSIRPFPMDKIDQFIQRGQYGRGFVNGKEVSGYRQESDVAANSPVETFVAAKFFIDNPRWFDVPFYFRAGKRLSKKLTEIVITFKTQNENPLEEYKKPIVPNQLVFRIQPEEEIYLTFNAKVPGHSDELLTQKLHWPLFQTHPGLPEAYEGLLRDAMMGNNSNFVSYEEHLAAWHLLSPVLKHWELHPPKDFPNYPAGSEGPTDQL